MENGQELPTVVRSAHDGIRELESWMVVSFDDHIFFEVELHERTMFQTVNAARREYWPGLKLRRASAHAGCIEYRMQVIALVGLRHWTCIMYIKELQNLSVSFLSAIRSLQ
jgi:hypothetical protein